MIRATAAVSAAPADLVRHVLSHGSKRQEVQVTASVAQSLAGLARDFPGEIDMGYKDAAEGRPWPQDYPSPAYQLGHILGAEDRRRAAGTPRR